MRLQGFQQRMNPHKREHIAHAGEQQDITALVGRILDFLNELGFADSGMQLLQKKFTAFAFFHLGNCIGYVQVVTEGKKDFVEIKVRMTADKRSLVQSHAAKMGESATGFINRAIDETMKRDNQE